MAGIAPVIPNFALTPAIAVVGIIDYNTNVGRKLYELATAKVAEELYDCKPDGLYQFLQSLSDRARAFGWDNEIDGILQIPEDPNDPMSETMSLIDNYGVITLEQIRRWEDKYVHLQVRPAQDTWMLYQCLMNSISKEGKDKVTIWKNLTASKLSGLEEARIAGLKYRCESVRKKKEERRRESGIEEDGENERE